MRCGRAIALGAAGLSFTAALLVGGCGAPSKANIALRKQNQALSAEIDKLKQDRLADQARIEGLENRIGTVPTLPESRLDQMYTVHSIKLGRLTGGTNLDPDRPWDQGIRVDLIPLDEAGDPIKATGRVSIELLDLNDNPPRRVGFWQFSAQQMKNTWRSLGPIHEFVLECPYQAATPTHSDLAVKVDFTDELTERRFEVLERIKVRLPPSTQPAGRQPQRT